MVGTIDELSPIMHESNATLVAALIGVFGALLGVLITMFIENHRRRKELTEKAKPIVITFLHTDSSKTLTGYIFQSDSTDNDKIMGTFKNTDNGILFIDYIKTETKKYSYYRVVAIEKNTTFIITLKGLSGETLKKCDIYCHDIYGTPYIYRAAFTQKAGKFNDITLIDSEPKKTKRKKQNKQK